MKVPLTRAEIGLLRLAIRLAVESEEELIASYTNRHTGKSIDPKVTRTITSRTVRMRRLREKLYVALYPQRAAGAAP